MDMWKRVPWGNMWMMFFAIVSAGMALHGFLGLHARFARADLVVALIMLGTVAITAVLRLPAREKSTPTLSDLGGIYLSAWKQLWRRNWVLRFFGLIAGVNLLASLAATLLAMHFIGDRVIKGTPPLDYLERMLPRMLSSIVSMSLGSFMPRSGLSSGLSVFFAAALLLALPWLLARLRGLRRKETYAKEAQFLQIALISGAIIAAAVIVLTPWEYALHRQAHPLPHQYWSVVGLKEDLWRLVHSSVLGAAIIAGLIGSLKSGDAKVTVDSFLRNSARYFKPLAGLYLLINVVMVLSVAGPQYGLRITPVWYMYYASGLITPALILFMFVPFSAVTRNIGTWDSIKGGLRDWFSNAWQVVSFAAVGVTFMTVAKIVKDMLLFWTPRVSWLKLAVTPVQVAINILVTAVMLLAVWEFYQLISKGETVEQSEA
jgi:hypothetical protein